MTDLLTGIDFKARSRSYTRESLPDTARIEAEITAALANGLSLCELAEALRAPYLAPDSDPA